VKATTVFELDPADHITTEDTRFLFYSEFPGVFTLRQGESDCVVLSALQLRQFANALEFVMTDELFDDLVNDYLDRLDAPLIAVDCTFPLCHDEAIAP
jgi:hypothetical protein